VRLRSDLTAERARELLSYDPETGVFRWAKTRPGKPAGKMTGALSHGYILIRVDNVLYRAHRVAFLIMEGAWPPCHVDHINGIRNDNRWANLRHATASENGRNKALQSNSGSGYKGVSFFKPIKKWSAYIGSKKKRFHLGYFETAEDAHAAYVDAAKKYYGEFARTE
jgi:hypothetical protein